MTLPALIWGAPHWLTATLGLWGFATLTLIWSYARARTTRAIKLACALFKALAFTAIVLSLLEPLLTGTRPRPGANAFVVLADNSQSLLIRDDQATQTRGDWVRDALRKESVWKTRLRQEFDVRNYVFDTHLRAVEGFDTLSCDGAGSALTTSLAAIGHRFHGLPLAGVLVFTDGNRTDLGDLDQADLPPIYPVIPSGRGVARDVGVARVSVSQTNFDAAPVILRADVAAVGFAGDTIVATVTDENGKDVDRQEAIANTTGEPLSFRFQFRPDHQGISFYLVHACAASDREQATEQTPANNTRLVVVDQGSGPYRILYVSGRPNWEFKFLRRAVADDEQIQLVGLVRIARRQPKFDFRVARSQPTSPLFDGFDHPNAETAERFDQPVLVRLGTRDEVELRDGFPKAVDEFYQYHAIVVDDLEAAFFTQDQLTLLRQFVGQRGGGLLMLGGPDSFVEGKYDRTPVGELLPVYLDRPGALAPAPAPTDAQDYRLVLTHEGWLQPWVRTRATEEDERQRLASMATFRTLNRVGGIKPGAMVLSEVSDPAGAVAPALVAQQFGRGHVAALLIGDLWRWGLRRADPAETDLDRSWRQTIRWLVSDVPDRIELTVGPKADAPPALAIGVRVRDAEFKPLDNAKVTLKVTLPGGDPLTLPAEPVGREAGAYATTYVPRQPGPYRILATATAPDGSLVGSKETGWAAQPAADEFARLEPDREFLRDLAARTHGEVIEGDHLAAFVASLSARHAPITEPWSAPLWHHPLALLLAIGCLSAEWGLRRINGLA